ncbi:hypothetical protein HOO54_13095 [Bacillus sp. WMMC1349]|uniref:hypothetical protein n=1 Tax=Bacillus sp. WMMC1349 TaxID=2736254 RepID=UPI001556D80D|nr:hypothetical protein [Bacillus sp. WMMC1349]NPC93142.1 hypothetical protein [Bacillus sp. WMMC1349]
MANDLEFIFEKASMVDENGKYIVNKELDAEKFGQTSVASIEAFVKMVNGEEIT